MHFFLFSSDVRLRHLPDYHIQNCAGCRSFFSGLLQEFVTNDSRLNEYTSILTKSRQSLFKPPLVVTSLGLTMRGTYVLEKSYLTEHATWCHKVEEEGTRVQPDVGSFFCLSKKCAPILISFLIADHQTQNKKSFPLTLYLWQARIKLATAESRFK